MSRTRFTGNARWRLRAGLLALTALAGLPLRAAPPPEVGATLRFDADKSTLTWQAVEGAESYNVYRGTLADASDLACLVFRTPDTSAGDPEMPGELFVYAVAGHNAEGDGPLGESSGGTPRTPAVACADDDGDGVRDDEDNCAGLANPAQRDQDLDGEGDPCDPATYDFEGDTVGARPAGVTQDGDADGTFLVRDRGGDLAAGYDGGIDGVHDRFDRLPAWRPFQDLDVYLDAEDVPGETLAVELWSEGTLRENAGVGVQFRIDADGSVAADLREGNSLTPLGPGASLPSTDRLRLRLRKDVGQASTLFVDRWDGSAWSEETSFGLADDHRLFGRGLAVVNRAGGRRALLRVTGNPLPPGESFALNSSFDGLADWKLYQRGPEGDAPIPVPFSYRTSAEARLEVRLAEQATGLPLPGFDWADHAWTLAAAPGGARDERSLASVPQGGNYRLEARLVDAGTEEVLGEDAVDEIAVGDVFLAAGQSNMSGYSGTLEPAEPPVPDVHLFGNDYVWKMAREPMDSGVDQVDRVSAENPLHTLMLRFGKEVAAGAGIPVAIVPAPLGGTNLHTQWQRRVDDPTNRGTLYGSAVHRVLAQRYVHPVRGVIWYQGESDVGRGTAAYRQDLENLVANFRSDLGNPDLFFGNCQLATYFVADPFAWLEIQEAQRQQAEADPLSAVVALVDQPLSDIIHLSVAGYKEAGLRLARAVLDRSYGVPTTPGPQLLSITFESPSARDRVLLTYDKDVTGVGQTQLFRVQDTAGLTGVTSVTASGDTVTLQLTRPAQGSTDVSYGFGRSPNNLWIVAADGSGAALTFDHVPVEE